MSVRALIVAAGTGSRAGSELPKQYVEVGGKPILRHALETFLAHPRVNDVLVVIHPAHEALFARAAGDLARAVHGGETRQESVRLGLEALAEGDSGAPEVVLIHDAARPFMPPALIDRLLAALEHHAGAVPGLEVVDTIKRVDERGVIVETPPRDMLRAVQTPQAFRFADILAAHRRAAALAAAFSDDAAVAEHAGLAVAVIDGAFENRKITHPEDFEWAEKLLEGKA